MRRKSKRGKSKAKAKRVLREIIESHTDKRGRLRFRRRP
jgi:hypothetical protein